LSGLPFAGGRKAKPADAAAGFWENVYRWAKAHWRYLNGSANMP
jgi:hypothetical protein